MTASYVPLFIPRSLPEVARPDLGHGDTTAASVYVFSDEITLAVNVALATGRPLLVRGPSGSGKTSLARSVAAQLGYRYREAVVTARTQARHLLATIDHLRRLQHAQLGKLSDDWRTYVAPGPLWWAFDPAGARSQQQRTGQHELTNETVNGVRTVLLIDEIDKADPDVPNSLLRPIGDLAFEIEETGQRVVAQDPPPFIVVTTNDERDLPPAFLRRCVELKMPAFDRGRLSQIGRAHLPKATDDLLHAAADLVLAGSDTRERRDPNPAEYLDVLRTCQQLRITPQSDAFRQLAGIVLGASSAP